MLDLSGVKTVTWSWAGVEDVAIRAQPGDLFRTTAATLDEIESEESLAEKIQDKEPQVLAYFNPILDDAPAFLYNRRREPTRCIMIRTKNNTWTPIRLSAVGRALHQLDEVENIVPLYPLYPRK